MTPKSVGSRIRYVRNQKEWTLDELAEKAGISKSFLWEVEQDRSDISGEKLLRVANALGASLDFLLRGEPTPKDYCPPTVEIPHELGQFAEEKGLTYQQTLALLDIHRSIYARRSSKISSPKTKKDWQELYAAVKDFL